MIKKILLFLIKFYQVAISKFTPPSCKYYPTCSAYAYEALTKHGVLKGIFLTIIRVLKCNPFSKGGYDPVPNNFFKTKSGGN